MREHLDSRRRKLSQILDGLTIEERLELTERTTSSEAAGWPPRSATAGAALDLIADTEADEANGLLPIGSANNLREIVRLRLSPGSTQ